MAAGVVAVTSHFALHQQNSAIPSRIGAVVPKRWARKAVTRNLIKRQIYALSIENLFVSGHADTVIRLRKNFDTAHFSSASSVNLKKKVREELQQLIQAAVAI